MTDVIKPTVAMAAPDRVANAQESAKPTTESPSGDFRHLLQREVTSSADFRHLLQNQASIPDKVTPDAVTAGQNSPSHGSPVEAQSPLGVPAHQDSLPQGMPKLALHDPSLKIGRVILTGDPTPAATSQLTQFMRDHGFSEGGMAGYMKQTMLGAGAAIADAGTTPAMQFTDSAALTAPSPLLGEAVLEVPPVAVSALPAAPVASETMAVPTGLNPGAPTKPDALPLPETKAPLPAEVPLPMRADAVLDEAVAPTSTKDILSAQWPQLQDEQRQAAVQSAEREMGAADVEFSNQQQSGQRSGSGEQNAPFNQANLANNEEAQTKAQQYREWSERFSELLGTRLAVAVREGSWSVQLDLDAMDLGSVAIQLSAGADGIEGQVMSSDPAVRQILAESLPKLQEALAQALGDQIDQQTVSLSIGPIEEKDTDNFKTIALSADELSNALPADFKAGDGLNVFV
jgi:hypothetical protein